MRNREFTGSVGKKLYNIEREDCVAEQNGKAKKTP